MFFESLQRILVNTYNRKIAIINKIKLWFVFIASRLFSYSQFKDNKNQIQNNSFNILEGIEGLKIKEVHSDLYQIECQRVNACNNYPPCYNIKANTFLF